MKKLQLVMERYALPVFASSLLVFAIGCSETESVDPIPQSDDISLVSGNIITEQYTVGPEGAYITALDKTVCLDFPEGAVYQPTLIKVSCFPIHHLDQNGLKLMNRGVSIEVSDIDKGFAQMVKIRMKYDFSSQKGVSVDEENLTIYSIYGSYYRHPNIYPIGECCVDCDCKSVIGCIGETGTYVVGEK
jgi:hypothetical protein